MEPKNGFSRYAGMQVSKALLLIGLVASIGCALSQVASTAGQAGQKHKFEVTHTDAEWRKLLTPDQYKILRTAGTEPAYTGKDWNNHAKGLYACAGCGTIVFSSDTKFESGTGWPSFWKPIEKKRVLEIPDSSLGMDRVEVLCAKCGGHLGHVFDDGPKPTGLRYCMNSGAMNFIPATKK